MSYVFQVRIQALYSVRATQMSFESWPAVSSVHTLGLLTGERWTMTEIQVVDGPVGICASMTTQMTFVNHLHQYLACSKTINVFLWPHMDGYVLFFGRPRHSSRQLNRPVVSADIVMHPKNVVSNKWGPYIPAVVKKLILQHTHYWSCMTLYCTFSHNTIYIHSMLFDWLYTNLYQLKAQIVCSQRLVIFILSCTFSILCDNIIGSHKL